jgi:hypothetical protein
MVRDGVPLPEAAVAVAMRDFCRIVGARPSLPNRANMAASDG